MTEETKPITCEEFEARVSEYLDGEVGGDDEPALTEHQRSCEQCQELTRAVLLTTRVLATLKEGDPRAQSERAALSMFLELYPEPAVAAGVDDWTTSKRLWQMFGGRSGALRINSLIASTSEQEREDLGAWLLGRAEVTLANDRRLSEDLARTALLLLERSTSKKDRTRLALCWAALAAGRALSSPHASALAAERAHELVAQETLDPRSEARFAMLEASRLSHRADVHAAEALLVRAQELFSGLKDRRRSLTTSISLAGNWLRAGRTEEAIDLLETIADTLGADDPTRLHLITQLNLAVAYCEGGKPEDAIQLMERIRPLVERVGGDWPLNLEWLRGTIARTLGDRSAALRSFRKVLDEFRRKGQVVQVLEAHLDILRTISLDFQVRESLECVDALAQDALAFGVPDDYLRSIALLKQAILRHGDAERFLTGLRHLDGLARSGVMRPS